MESYGGVSAEDSQPLLPNSQELCHRRTVSAIQSGTLLGSDSVCAVCLGELACSSSTCSLPRCGHCFHALCLASALQVSPPLCPLCRLEVAEGTGLEVARGLLAAGGSDASLAAELLMELQVRSRTPESELTDQELVDSLRRSAKQGETANILSIAALLGDRAGGGAQASRQVQ
ncbi:unnamed protein product, partial [Polarella glacialis]